MKKKKLIGMFIILLSMCGCSAINKVQNQDVIDYLNSKYGDHGFYFVEEDECNLLNLGTCSSIFSSSDLGNEVFSVTWYDGNGKDMKDTFIEKLYSDELSNYYAKYFDGKLSFGYSIDAILDDSCDECNKRFISYEEYLKLIQGKGLSIYININDNLTGNNYFHLKTSDNSVDLKRIENSKEEIRKYIQSKYDLDNLSSDITKIITSNQLGNINNVVFRLNDCSDGEYVASCSYTYDLYSR